MACQEPPSIQASTRSSYDRISDQERYYINGGPYGLCPKRTGPRLRARLSSILSWNMPNQRRSLLVLEHPHALKSGLPSLLLLEVQLAIETFQTFSV